MAEILLRLIDVAAKAREMFGDAADEIAAAGGHRSRLPEHDWRFELTYLAGRVTTGSDDLRHGNITFHAGADASHVAAYLEHEGLLPAESTKDGT